MHRVFATTVLANTVKKVPKQRMNAVVEISQSIQQADYVAVQREKSDSECGLQICRFAEKKQEEEQKQCNG